MQSHDNAVSKVHGSIIIVTHKTPERAETHQEGTLRVESVGAAHVDAPIAQELQQTDVVVAVNLQRETNPTKRGLRQRRTKPQITNSSGSGSQLVWRLIITNVFLMHSGLSNRKRLD